MKKSSRLLGALLGLLPLVSWSIAASPAKEGAGGKTSSPPALQILSDTALSEPFRYAVDVRWASDRSVYLALKRRGVVEYGLDSKKVMRQMIPGENEPGGFWLSYQIAVSRSYLLAGSPLALTWRPLDSAVRKEDAFEFLSDMDVHENRVAVGGPRRDSNGDFAPEGAIVWIGSLDKDLGDLRPLLFDARGPGAPNVNACGILHLGATRFLPDGSLIVVPGVQPGIYRFDPQGKLVQTLDTVGLGIDTDCASVSEEQMRAMDRKYPPRLAWVNARRIVDDVLPLPAGPGLLIRSFREGQVRWTLKVLRPDGDVAIYDVPVRPQTPYAHLKGDIRQGRLVLLLWGYSEDGKPDGAPIPRLLTVSMPSL